MARQYIEQRTSVVVHRIVNHPKFGVDVLVTSDHQWSRERRQALQQVAEVVEERLRHADGAWTTTTTALNPAQWTNAATTSIAKKTDKSTLRARNIAALCPTPTKRGKVIVVVRIILAPRKRVRIRQVSARL